MLKLIVAVVSWPLLVVGAENTDFVQSEFTYKKKKMAKMQPDMMQHKLDFVIFAYV